MKIYYEFYKTKVVLFLILLSYFVTPVIFSSTDAYAQTGETYDEHYFEEIASGIFEWKKVSEKTSLEVNLIESHLSNAAGTPAADWYAIAAGMFSPDSEFPVYLNSLYEFVNNEYAKGISPNASPIDFHRIILAINSLGGDASKVPTATSGENIDLISDFVYNRENLNMLINTLSFGLMALDSRDYEIPAGSVFSREKIIGEIINMKIPGKGFALTGNISDPDITAMVIQSLAPYYDNETKYTFDDTQSHGISEITVKEVIDESLNTLSKIQLESGDFRSWGNRNSQTGAQVIIALCKLGINPMEDDRFIKNGVSLVDGLIGYKQGNKGFANLSDSTRSDSKASEQALLAMTAMLIQKRDEAVIFIFEKSVEENSSPFSEQESESESNPDSLLESSGVETSRSDDDENNNRNKIIIPLGIVFVAIIFSGIIIVTRRKKL